MLCSLHGDQAAHASETWCWMCLNAKAPGCSRAWWCTRGLIPVTVSGADPCFATTGNENSPSEVHVPRRRRSGGGWTGALCARTPCAPAQPTAPCGSPASDAVVPCMGAGKPCTDPATPWLTQGCTHGPCVSHAPRGNARALDDLPVKRELFGCRQASSSSASTATQAGLRMRPALEAALHPLPARAACASAPDLGLLDGCERAPGQPAPPQAACKPDGGAVQGCERARAQPGPLDARNDESCTCSPWRAPTLQRLLDVDQHGQLTVAQGYAALRAATAARGATPGAPCPAWDGRVSTLVRARAAACGCWLLPRVCPC